MSAHIVSVGYFLPSSMQGFRTGLSGARAEIEKKEKRQKEGIEAKKARGEWADYGRPKAQKPSNWDEVIELWKNGEITAVEAMKRTDTKKTTFYKLLKE